MGRYVVGVDFGTLSGRAVLVDVENGEEIACSVYDYPHGVMDEKLPSGMPLRAGWALQHPTDYIQVLSHTLPEVLRQSGVEAGQVKGIGVDFTACTLSPCLADGTPLCFAPQYRERPHAYAKLWKHHAAQDKADAINALAEERGEAFLARYGGKTSSEWLLPKVWQMLEEDEELYRKTACFVEATDWIVWQLTGKLNRSACTLGYKALWSPETGFPAGEFLRALHPMLERMPQEKLYGPILPLGAKAGEVTEEAASLTGLQAGTAVAVGNVDAHVTVPAVGIQGPGKLLAILGTSTCHMLLGEREANVPGICGVVKDGILPGLYGYEAGQSCVGDHFAWFIENCLPGSYRDEAAEQGKNIHAYLREKAQKLRPGESGLLALDWWNGNRSVLVDADLSGLLLGMTLQTKPEEIYRALIEATAYGTRRIIEAFEENGVPVEEFYASGGISQKDGMAMQIYADVTGKPVHITGAAQGPALGAALFGAVAAGEYASIGEASARMAKGAERVYRPVEENRRIYDTLYREYLRLHDCFGRGENDVMKRLRELKNGGK